MEENGIIEKAYMQVKNDSESRAKRVHGLFFGLLRKPITEATIYESIKKVERITEAKPEELRMIIQINAKCTYAGQGLNEIVRNMPGAETLLKKLEREKLVKIKGNRIKEKEEFRIFAERLSTTAGLLRKWYEAKEQANLCDCCAS